VNACYGLSALLDVFKVASWSGGSGRLKMGRKWIGFTIHWDVSPATFVR